MKSMFAIGFVFTALLSMFNTMYVFFIVHRRLCMILSETFIGKEVKIILIQCVLYRFDGHVVAKLPFTPISWIQGISHRGLLGDDFTDCSFIFLYIVSTMSIRQVPV